MSRPPCPNHRCEMDPTDDRRIWICPRSGARFECDVETQEGRGKIKYDTFGNVTQEWNVVPLDGDGG